MPLKHLHTPRNNIKPDSPEKEGCCCLPGKSLETGRSRMWSPAGGKVSLQKKRGQQQSSARPPRSECCCSILGNFSLFASPSYRWWLVKGFFMSGWVHLGWKRTYFPALFLSNYKSDVNAGLRNGGRQENQGQKEWGLPKLCVRGHCGTRQITSANHLIVSGTQFHTTPKYYYPLGWFDLKSLQEPTLLVIL